MKKSEEPILKEIVKKDFMKEKEGKKEYDRTTKERSETNWEERSLHGKFPKSTVNFTKSVLWQ